MLLCSRCGQRLASEPASIIPSKRPASLKKIFLGFIGVWLLLVALRVAFHPVNQSVGPMADPQKSEPTPAPAPSTAAIKIGDTVKIAFARQANGREGYWPCGSSKEALDEMTKWAGRGDEAELKLVMRSTKSIALTAGLRVKVLEAGGFPYSIRKVRVVANSDGQAYLRDEQGEFPADPRIGHECWIVNEALTHRRRAGSRERTKKPAMCDASRS